jgi:hypothetical protein
MDPRVLHVANGTSTTRTIEAAGIPGVTSIWADPLHDGPVPGVSTTTRWPRCASRITRRRPRRPIRSDFGRWRQVITHHDAYDN